MKLSMVFGISNSLFFLDA